MQNLLRRPYLIWLIIAAVSGLMHLRIFTTDIVGPHAWRQTQTVATIEHFARNSFDITEPHTYHFVNGTTRLRMEFPLLQWSVAAVYRVFGEHLWLMRSILFLVGVFTVLGMMKVASALFQRHDATFFAGWTFCFSPLFYYYCINPLPDVLALFFSVWGLAMFFRWNNSGEMKSLILCVVFLALGTLCKLPYIIFYSVFFGWIWNAVRSRSFTFKKLVPVGSLIAVSLVAAVSWYAVVMNEWTPNMVISGILDNTLSLRELFDIVQGNVISTLPELLLNYAAVPFFLVGLYFLLRRKRKANIHFVPLVFMGCAILFYYFFELNAITLVHDYYMLPFLPALFILVTYGAIRLVELNKSGKVASIIFIVLIPIAAFLRCDGRWNQKDPKFNPDLLTYKNELRNAVPTDAKIVIGNDESAHISLYYTQHHGWNFQRDELTATDLEMMISSGATYLYSDSEIIENDPYLQASFGDTIAVIGSYRIIELKTPFGGPNDTTEFKRGDGLVH